MSLRPGLKIRLGSSELRPWRFGLADEIETGIEELLVGNY